MRGYSDAVETLPPSLIYLETSKTAVVYKVPLGTSLCNLPSTFYLSHLSVLTLPTALPPLDQPLRFRFILDPLLQISL